MNVSQSSATKLQMAMIFLVVSANEDVKRIASVLNITRIYNSICALGHMRRALDLAQDYLARRKPLVVI
jgi:alkylation response protein AidB-like acyl-CoA dehydrogenase